MMLWKARNRYVVVGYCSSSCIDIVGQTLEHTILYIYILYIHSIAYYDSVMSVHNPSTNIIVKSCYIYICMCVYIVLQE